LPAPVVDERASPGVTDMSHGRTFAEALLRSRLPDASAFRWDRYPGEDCEVVTFVARRQRREIRLRRSALEANDFVEISALIHAQTRR
jgi:hypothetical protein